jgi:hypothetical protein
MLTVSILTSEENTKKSIINLVRVRPASAAVAVSPEIQ